MSNSLRPHGLQHTRPPCPSPTPGACSNSCRSSQWCHPAISSSVVPFSSHLQSFPASGSFPVSQFFASSGQRIAVSASASVLPMNIQDWFPLGLTGLISLLSRGLARIFRTTQFKSINSLALSFLYSPIITSIQTTGTTIALTRQTFVGKLMSLLLNMLSRFVIAFLPRSKHLLISRLQSPSAVILEPKKIKVCHCFHCFPMYLHEVMGLDAMTFIFWMLSFKPAFSLSSFTFIKRLFSSSSLSAIRVVSSAYLRLLIFLPAISILTLYPAWHFTWCTLYIS